MNRDGPHSEDTDSSEIGVVSREEKLDLNVQPATDDDVLTVITLTRSTRRKLADWSPIYFNPRSGADQNHANFLSFLIGSDQHLTSVLTVGDQTVGFFTVIDQDVHQWVDDLCLEEPHLWEKAIRAIGLQVGRPWVTCISVHDVDRLQGAEAAGMVRSSTYFARVLDSDETAGQADGTVDPPTSYKPSAPQHTFGGGPFSPQAAGALVVLDELGGYVVGSASAEPPIFDPGGPTCVIDQVVGPDRASLIRQAAIQAKRRGDAQLVVVAAELDRELAALLLELDFKAEVHLYRSD